MIILALDTALDACQVAILGGDDVLAHISEPMARGQAERIAPMVKEAMQTAGLRFDQLDRIIVTTGPGSFTGVRVGLAFARALALALGKSCMGVSTLEALALEAAQGGQEQHVLRAALVETPGAAYVALYENGRSALSPRAVEKIEIESALHAAANGRPFTLRASSERPIDVIALARRTAVLEPRDHPPAPLYLRAALKQMSPKTAANGAPP